MRRWMLLLVAVVAVAGSVSAQTGDHVFPQSVASGDPRPTSVVLWTRVVPPDGQMPRSIQLDVASDPDFGAVVISRNVDLNPAYDGVVKVRVDGLSPYTIYYYRFRHREWTSRVGRTKTAPSPDMDVPVKFAVVYCQDFIDRYYNSYLKLLNDFDDDIDFVVNLGDYIYETTGGSDDTPGTTQRKIVFNDLKGALSIGTPSAPEFAAASLDNYRQLYRTYRSDPVLQRVHERWPMIVVWDDHEFSNDHWDATATYTSGRVTEYQPDRRRNAEQAFFEWVPIEVGIGSSGTLDINASIMYPNTRIYRDFMFGSMLHLVLADSRTYRPDHLVPEDAFPGAIAVDQQGLIDLLGDLAFEQVKGSFDPYVDMDVLGAFLPILKQTTTLIAAQAYLSENPALDSFSAVKTAEAALAGKQSATFINTLYSAAGYTPPFSLPVLATLPRGVSYLLIGKTSMYSSSGSRTAVLHDTFNLLAAHLYLTTAGAAQEVYGGLQTAWMQGALIQSPARWKVLGQTVMMTPLVIDFTNPLIAAQLPPGFPAMLRTRLGLNVEDFNGFPQKRLEMIGLLSVVPNSVVISGDIHSAFVTDHTNGVYEFTGPSVSSATFGDGVARAIATHPIFGQIPGLGGLVAQLGLLLQLSSLDDVRVSPSDIVYTDIDAHGFMIMEANAQALRAVMYRIPASQIGTSYYDDPEALDELFTTMPFTVSDGKLLPGQ